MSTLDDFVSSRIPFCHSISVDKSTGEALIQGYEGRWEREGSALTYTRGRESRVLVEMRRNRRRSHQTVHDDSRMAKVYRRSLMRREKNQRRVERIKREEEREGIISKGVPNRVKVGRRRKEKRRWRIALRAATQTGRALIFSRSRLSVANDDILHLTFDIMISDWLVRGRNCKT